MTDFQTQSQSNTSTGKQFLNVFESDECFGHESEQEVLQGEGGGDQVETEEELIPDHDMTQCSPPAPASTSFPLAQHVEPELHPQLHVDRSEQLLTASTERDSGSSMRLAALLLAATASTTPTSTRDESATRRISTVCGEPDKWRSGQCELGQREAQHQLQPLARRSRQRSLARPTELPQRKLEQGRACGPSRSEGAGPSVLRDPHSNGRRPWFCLREKRARSLASVRDLSAVHPLCASSWSQRDFIGLRDHWPRMQRRQLPV